MDEVVVCDTNVAIHLAIICPDVLRSPDSKCKIVIHSIVKNELHKLNANPDKQERIGEVLTFLLKEVKTDSKIGLPTKDKEIQMHRRIQKFESGLDPELISSSSSHQDRCFLILAKTHNAKLLTNDKTLYSLGAAFLPNGNTWKTSSALEFLLNGKIVAAKDVQQGLGKLIAYQEFLHADCVQKMKALGFTF